MDFAREIPARLARRYGPRVAAAIVQVVGIGRVYRMLNQPNFVPRMDRMLRQARHGAENMVSGVVNLVGSYAVDRVVNNVIIDSGYGSSDFTSSVSSDRVRNVMTQNALDAPRSMPPYRAQGRTYQPDNTADIEGPLVHPQDNCSASRVRIPGTLRDSKFFYDPHGHTHGVISSRDFLRMSSNVAKALSETCAHRKDIDQLARYENFITNKQYAFTAQMYGQKRYELVWTKSVMSFVNRNTFAVHLALFDVVLKEDIPGSLADTFHTFQEVLTQAVNQREGYLQNAGNPDVDPLSGLDDIDLNIKYLKSWRRWYKLVKSTSVVLAPGECHVHTVFSRPRYVFDATQEANVPVRYKAGLYSETYVRAVGKVVHIKTGTKPPTVSNVAIDYLAQHKAYIREVSPLADYFVGQLSGDDYPGINGAADTVEQMDIGDPTLETGAS